METIIRSLELALQHRHRSFQIDFTDYPKSVHLPVK